MGAKTVSKRKATGVEPPAKKARTTRLAPAAQTTVAVASKDALPFDDEHDEEEDKSENDHTAALLKGFESSDDEDEQESAIDIKSLPDPTKAKSAAAAEPSDNQSRVIYISRVPHGFYESQMKAYLAQFGDVTRLRLARNRRTGASKHFAFVEFADAQVASVVQRTMDNYLMFKHILKVKMVPPEKVHPDLFKGAGKRFKRVPWNRIERFRVASTDRAGWQGRITREEQRRADKQAKLAALGYEFSAPAIRSVEGVPKKTDVEDTEEPKALPAPEREATAVEQIVNASKKQKPSTKAKPLEAKKVKAAH